VHRETNCIIVLQDATVSQNYLPIKMEETVCSETSELKIQTHWELLRRQNITFRKLRKFEIMETNECLNVICAVHRYVKHEGLTNRKFIEIDSQHNRKGNIFSCISTLRIQADILKGCQRSVFYFLGNTIFFIISRSNNIQFLCNTCTKIYITDSENIIPKVRPEWLRNKAYKGQLTAFVANTTKKVLGIFRKNLERMY